MKTLTLSFALFLFGTTSMAISMNSGSVTPTLRFPKDTTGSETVTREEISLDH